MSLLSNLHYGPHPSVIMWESGNIVEEEDANFFFGGFAKKLESLLQSTPDSMFNTFKFDAVVKEQHQAENTITKFPVSSGFLVSEHSIIHNRILRLSAVASNMQNSKMGLMSVQGLSVISGAIFDNPVMPVIGGIAGGIASVFETSDRVQYTYNLFNTFRVNGTKLYINTIAGQYLNCVVQKVETFHDKMTQAILQIDVTLEELQVVDDDQVTVAARRSMEDMYDYSGFVGAAATIGVGLLSANRMSLPGLGNSGSSISNQFVELKKARAYRENIKTDIRGVLLNDKT